MRDIEKEARALLRRVLKRYYAASKWTRRALSEMIEEELSRYNKRVQKIIEPMIYDELRSAFKGEPLPEVVPTKAQLSEMLYKNAKDAAAVATKILWDAQKSGATVQELAMRLYEGYGFRDKEVLEVKKKLPKYLERHLSKRTVQNILERRVSKLRTSPLRAAYRRVVKAVELESDTALRTATRVAIEERARYYATRIARTEEARSYNLANSKRLLEDDEIELVRYKMSTLHPMTDICDYYASLDVGYGKGVVPKSEMISLPLHPHCRCHYVPYYHKTKRKGVKDPERETLQEFSDEEQRAILGGWSAWDRWRKGVKAEAIWNAQRPKYPIKKVMEVIQ